MQHQKHWRRRALAAALASIAGLAGNASAFEIDTGNPDIETRWDNTFRYNVAVRAQGQDPAILRDPNLDDGDHNFSNGSLVANRLDILPEFVLLSKNISGVSLGAELSYRQNMPLVSEPVTVLPAPLAAATPGAIATTVIPANGDTPGTRGNTMHGIVNGIFLIPKTALFDTFQVFPGVDLTLPLNWSQGLSGNSAVLLGGNKGAGSWSAGLTADIVHKYNVALQYTGHYGNYTTDPVTGVVTANGPNASLSDRSFASLTLKATF